MPPSSGVPIVHIAAPPDPPDSGRSPSLRHAGYPGSRKARATNYLLHPPPTTSATTSARFPQHLESGRSRAASPLFVKPPQNRIALATPSPNWTAPACRPRECSMSVQLFVPTFQIEECLTEIRECLEKGWTGLGFKTVEFEKRWCEHTGLHHAHFVSSATAALHLAVNVFRTAYGWADDDEIITTPLTFVSSNHVILYERLKPVFADVDDMLCLEPADVERKITLRTRAVMFVGIGGNTGQLPAIKAFC